MTTDFSNTTTTCAACHGEIAVDKNVCTVFYAGVPIDLCEACMMLGAEDAHELSAFEIELLVVMRADPSAPISGIDEQVNMWIQQRFNKQGDTTTLPNQKE